MSEEAAAMALLAVSALAPHMEARERVSARPNGSVRRAKAKKKRRRKAAKAARKRGRKR